jgi:predicted CopG family antitoxin
MSDDDTSVRISVETWRRLKDRKDRPNTSFDDVITELLNATEDCDEGNARTTATAD